MTGRYFMLLWVLFLASSAYAQPHLKLATTTSTDDSGLLDVLLPPFEQKHTVKVDVIAVGTGKALKIAENGDVDVVMVHARRLEDAFVAAGYGVDRRDVMYNDFVIVGPASDPAGLSGMKDVAGAFRRIQKKQAVFLSRGDESGTHQKERAIWAATGIMPERDWYVEVGQGMGATMRIADEKRGYCLVDRGTYLALRKTLELNILVEGDALLHNPYGIIAIDPKRWPHVKYDLAQALINWVTSTDGQAIIAGFKKYGEPLFKPFSGN